MAFSLLTFLQNVFSLLLGGEKCLVCSDWALRIPLCKKCSSLLWNIGFERCCSKCGKPLISEIGLCSLCRKSPALQNVDAAYSLHCYQLWKKSLLFAWKLEDKRTLSVYFAALVYRKLKSIEEENGIPLAVVPVPPRPGKIKERGWDQIDELCWYLRKGWGVKILPLLERISKVQQKKLDREGRVEGINSSYRLKNEKKVKKICKEVPPALVLVDDVMTTGSTIESCARQLKKFGVKQVFSITLFTVD